MKSDLFYLSIVKSFAITHLSKILFMKTCYSSTYTTVLL